MIKVNTKSNLDKIDAYLKKIKDDKNIVSILEKYGAIGVEKLAAATPTKGGKTADSWHYAIKKDKKRYSIQFYNTNVVNGTNIAIILQTGHSTRNGGYVKGTDYINPVTKSVFNDMVNELVKEVRRI